MNNAKRILTFALAVCSLSAFASCGSSSDSSSKVVDKKLKEDQQQIEVLEKLFHSSSPPSSEEPSSNLFMIHMQMKMRMIITSAMAEPRCGLYAPPMN